MKKHLYRIEWLLFTNKQNKDQQVRSIYQIYFTFKSIQILNETYGSYIDNQRAQMTFLYHSVLSYFDKNAISLQHIDAFSIGSEHCLKSGVKTCSMGINISKLNLPALLLVVMMYSVVILHKKSTLGSGDMAISVSDMLHAYQNILN